MARSSNAEAILTDLLTRSIGLALDEALLDDQPASDARPAGLRYGIAASAASTAPNSVDALMSDIETLSRAVEPATAVHPIILASQTRALTAELRSYHGLRLLTVLGSHALIGTMIIMAIAPNAIASILGSVPEILAVRDAASIQLDTAPDGTLSTKSLWQADCVAILVRLPVTWGLRSATGVAWLTATNW